MRSECMKLAEGHSSCPNGGLVSCNEHDSPPAGPLALQLQQQGKRFKVSFASMPGCKPYRFTNASLLLLQWAGGLIAEPARSETALPDIFDAAWNGAAKKQKVAKPHK